MLALIAFGPAVLAIMIAVVLALTLGKKAKPGKVALPNTVSLVENLVSLRLVRYKRNNEFIPLNMKNTT